MQHDFNTQKSRCPAAAPATFLDRILAAKRDELTAAKALVSQRALEVAAAQRRSDYRDFTAALTCSGIRIIAEIKRASPSQGDIAGNLDPAVTACAYEEGGAAAISVLTEPAFFKGSAADLQAARSATALPTLRKEFIIEPYQVYESVVMGADAILLIVRLLDDEMLHALHKLAREAGLAVLTEIFDESDARRANTVGARLVGINSRDLARFTTDCGKVGTLAALLQSSATPVALSGIHDAARIRDYLSAGISRFLIGEALVRQSNPAALLKQWSRLDTAQTAATSEVCCGE